MTTALAISDADVVRIADAVVERLQAKPAPASDWLTREQVEQYLNLSRTAFFNLRAQHPVALKPACEHPLRWSRKALELFSLTRGMTPTAPRRGRRPNL